MSLRHYSPKEVADMLAAAGVGLVERTIQWRCTLPAGHALRIATNSAFQGRDWMPESEIKTPRVLPSRVPVACETRRASLAPPAPRRAAKVCWTRRCSSHLLVGRLHRDAVRREHEYRGHDANRAGQDFDGGNLYRREFYPYQVRHVQRWRSEQHRHTLHIFKGLVGRRQQPSARLRVTPGLPRLAAPRWCCPHDPCRARRPR